MKKVLVQLDTDEHASPFDAIVAHDAGVDVLLSYARVTPEKARALVQDAFFTRGVPDLATIAVWVGGSDVPMGEQILAEVQGAFFGPFRVSAMLDSAGCNTTAATAIAHLAKAIDVRGRRAVVVGLGPVGLRSATLLAREGCEVVVTTLPPDLFPGPPRRPRGLAVAQEVGLTTLELANSGELETALEGASIVLTAGPAGVEVLPHEVWTRNPTLELLADYNAAEPLGIGGVKATDDLVERDGKRVLGALGIGDPKMRTHKACIRLLFERNDVILDVDGVYEVAREQV